MQAISVAWGAVGALAMIGGGISAAWGQTPPSSAVQEIAAKPSAGPVLTIYQNGQTLVVDSRVLTLPSQLAASGSEIAFENVSGGLLPPSAQVLLPVSAGGAQVLQLRYQPAVNEPQMLRAMVGKQVWVTTRAADGANTTRQMTLLRAEPSPVLQDGAGVVFGLPGQVSFSEIPSHLSLVPRLSATVVNWPAAQAGKDTAVTLRYLTSGLSWTANHVATLNHDQDQVSLSSWASVSNATGTRWQGASVALVAGSVAADPTGGYMPKVMPMAMRAEMAPPPAPMPPQPEAMGGYYLYALQQAVTLEDGETRQVALGTEQTVPAHVIYQSQLSPSPQGAWRGEQVAHADMILEFALGKDSYPLPAGTMRVYGEGQSAQSEGRFLGADTVPATPAGEQIKAALGQAFDVTVTQTQTSFRKLSDSMGESSYRVVIHNGQDKERTVDLLAGMYGDWEIFQESTPHSKTSAGEAKWSIPVKAKSDVVLTYSVRVSL